MASESRKLLPKAGKPSENLVIGDAAHDRFPKTALKKHRPSYVTRLRDWAGSLLDAKPYEVRESWGTTTWHLSKRLFTLTILVGAISLGIIQQSFDISKRSIGQTFQLNEDVQLAVFGLLNTALALMVRDSLSHIADTVVTMWMISGHGASPLDFEMYDESIKPWVAVANVHARQVTHWIIRDAIDGDKPGYSIDDYGKTRYPAMHHLPASTGDADIGKQISDWFNAILPNLQSLSSREDVLNLTSLVTQLANVIVKLDKGHTTTDGLSIVLSTIFSNFLTTFHWTFTEIPNETTKHGPVRWQIYGSGPRLPWQWLSAAVIAVSIVVQLVDIFCVLWHRSMKGHWLSLGGMLVAANAAERMDSVAEDQGAGFLREKDKFVRYYLSRKVSGDGAAKATLVDDDGLGNGYGRLKEGEKYGDVERH
ncbi:hypothetical protein N0V95_002401 [Ascochyta clinopodiicola]|nr:hypothetical protein N0V95_002401 [Ascochyta clinopodiicola]